mgnify:CR=1 FL=1
MLINRPYSFNSLAAIIASLGWESRVINLSKIQFLFTDCDVEVEGEMIGTFDKQKGTYEQPEYNDLVDVDVEITSVFVSGEQKELIYNWEEKEKLEQTIKKLLI